VSVLTWLLEAVECLRWASLSAYVLYSCGCSLDVSAPCRLTQLLTARNCPHSCSRNCSPMLHWCNCACNCLLHAPAPLMQLRMQLLTHLRMQLLTQLLAAHSWSRSCSLQAPAPWMRRAPAPWMRRAPPWMRRAPPWMRRRTACKRRTAWVDRGLPSVRSARGLQGRQELELPTPGARCWFRLRALGNFCAKRARRRALAVVVINIKQRRCVTLI